MLGLIALLQSTTIFHQLQKLSSQLLKSSLEVQAKTERANAAALAGVSEPVAVSGAVMDLRPIIQLLTSSAEARTALTEASSSAADTVPAAAISSEALTSDAVQSAGMSSVVPMSTEV